MKRAIFTIIFFLTATIYSYCQNWAPVGATWTFGTHDGFGYGQGFKTWTCIGDTLVGGHNYKIIERNSYAVDWEIIVSRFYSYEDSNTLYFFDTTRNQFAVLYDYNKNAGESWTITFDTISTTFTVDSVGTFNMNGFPLKVQYVQSPNYYDTTEFEYTAK